MIDRLGVIGAALLVCAFGVGWLPPLPQSPEEAAAMEGAIRAKAAVAGLLIGTGFGCLAGAMVRAFLRRLPDGHAAARLGPGARRGAVLGTVGLFALFGAVLAGLALFIPAVPT